MWKGISFPFKINPNKGGVVTSQADNTDFTHIRESIYQILGTRLGERPYLRSFGSLLHLLNFEPMNSSTIGLARYYIIKPLLQWEPRIIPREVEVTPDQDNGELVISLAYTLLDYDVDDQVFFRYNLSSAELQFLGDDLYAFKKGGTIKPIVTMPAILLKNGKLNYASGMFTDWVTANIGNVTVTADNAIFVSGPNSLKCETLAASVEYGVELSQALFYNGVNLRNAIQDSQYKMCLSVYGRTISDGPVLTIQGSVVYNETESVVVSKVLNFVSYEWRRDYVTLALPVNMQTLDEVSLIIKTPEASFSFWEDNIQLEFGTVPTAYKG